MPAPDPVDRWLVRLIERHTRALSKPEFLKAVRALSSRYVERRADLPRRSPTDSAGKRAAFSGFFAPLHFFTARAVVEALGPAALGVETIIDLGCGSGVASAAWALASAEPPDIVGVDQEAWALDEAAWNWRELGLRGRTKRADFVTAASDLVIGERPRRRGRVGIVLGWSANELDRTGRDRLLPALIALQLAGAAILVIEPIARGAAPWWSDWSRAATAAGGTANEWRFDLSLPDALTSLDEAAGFQRDLVLARSLWWPAPDPRS